MFRETHPLLLVGVNVDVRVIVELVHDATKFVVAQAVRMDVNVVPSLLLAKVDPESFRTENSLVVLVSKETIVSSKVETEEGTLVLLLGLGVELNDRLEVDGATFFRSMPAVPVSVFRRATMVVICSCKESGRRTRASPGEASVL